MKLSGLQKEVLSLYRQCLRESRRKPAVSTRLGLPVGWGTSCIKKELTVYRALGRTLSRSRGKACRPFEHEDDEDPDSF